MVAGLVLAALIGFAGLNPHLPGGGDNAEYIAQAEALNQFGRRANIHLDGDPEDTFRPPLYPWLLAAVLRVCGRNVTVLKAINVLFALAAVAAAWWFLIKTLPAVRDSANTPADAEHEGGESETGSDARDLSALKDAGWIALWFALMPVLLHGAHDVLSDVPFTCLVLIALGCVARAERPNGVRWLTASLILLVLAMLLRTAALLVSGALAGYFILDLLLRLRQPVRRWLVAKVLVYCAFTVCLLFWASRGTQTYLGPGQMQRSHEAGSGSNTLCS